MPSARQKGKAALKRTRDWLTPLGWEVTDLEFSKTILLPGKPPIFKTYDTWAADLMASSEARDELWIIQVCSHPTQVAARVRALREAPWPRLPGMRLFVCWWTPRSLTKNGPNIRPVWPEEA